VGWIALPSAALDYSARAERALVLGGLPYLRLQWENENWLLYRVTLAAPAATGVLRAEALTDTGVDLWAREAGTGYVRAPYSRLLVVQSTTDPGVFGCVSRSPDGGSRVDVPSAGPYAMHAAATALTHPCSPAS
jgi:hypothetical protein